MNECRLAHGLARSLLTISQENVCCVMNYILDLTVILDGIFRTAAGDMSPDDAQPTCQSMFDGYSN